MHARTAKTTAPAFALATALGVCAGFAHASIATGDIGAPVIVDRNNARATVEFIGSNAGYTGELFFRGSGATIGSIENPAIPGGPEEGLLLFNNKQSERGSVVELPGLYQTGTVLHFGYGLTKPARVAGQGFFTDLAQDQNQFAFDASTGLFSVEDLRLPGGDRDYNDAVFRVTFATVPAPGAMLGLGVLGLLGARRGRRGPGNL